MHVGLHRAMATLHGDLTQPGVLPENAFGCIVLTQTLHFIFELDHAIERLHAALKPGGTLLLTVPELVQSTEANGEKVLGIRASVDSTIVSARLPF